MGRGLGGGALALGADIFFSFGGRTVNQQPKETHNELVLFSKPFNFAKKLQMFRFIYF